MIYDKETLSFLLKHPTEFEFFSGSGFSGPITIPVIFGAKEWSSLDELLAFQSRNGSLKNFIPVERYTNITIYEADLS